MPPWRKISCTLALLLLTLGTSSAHAAQRWVILTSLESRNDAAKLQTELARIDGIEVSQRDFPVDEYPQPNAPGGGAAGAVGAAETAPKKQPPPDGLLLLTTSCHDSERYVRALFLDTASGSRLYTGEFKWDDSPATKIAAAFRTTLARFPDGVKQVYCVPKFIPRALAPDTDNSAARYSQLLADALARRPGVALLEIENAPLIAHEIGGAAPKRIVPAYVQAEFRQDPVLPGRPTKIWIKATVSQPSALPREYEITFADKQDAADWITHDLAANVRNFSPLASLTVEEQTKLLLQSADDFAKLGEWATASSLREAALVLAPANKDQRRTLMMEYRRIMVRNYPMPEEQRRRDNLLFTLDVRERVDAYLRLLQHVEYLVLNKHYYGTQGPDVARDADPYVFVPYYIPTTGDKYWRVGQEELLRVENAKIHFFRTIYPKVLDCPIPAEWKQTPTVVRRDWSRPLLRMSLYRIDRTYHKAEGLPFIEECLLQMLPAFEAESELFSFLENMPYFPYSNATTTGPDLVTPEQWTKWLGHLTDNDNHTIKAVGSLGLLLFHARQLRESKNEDLDRWQGLAADAKSVRKEFTALLAGESSVYGFASHGLSIIDNIQKQVVERTAKKPAENPPAENPKSNPPSPGPAPAPPAPQPIAQDPAKPQYDADPFIFTPLALKYKGIGGDVLDLSALGATPFPVRGGSGPIRNVIKCDDIDVFWTYGTVMFMRKKNLLEVILYDNNLNVTDVTWDGQFIWIASQLHGIMIYKPDGTLVAKLNAADGLPSFDRECKLAPAGPGRVFAAGSFGESSRAWIADLRLNNSQASFQILHECTRVLQSSDDRKDFDKDRTSVFTPSLLWTRQRAPGDWIALVHRGTSLPLLVDPKAKKVETTTDPGIVRADDNGRWLDADSYHAILNSRGAPLSNGKQQLDMCIDRFAGGGLAGTILDPGDGWWYFPGGTWWRINQKTFAEERLTQWRVPPAYTSDWYGLSAHYGMVVFAQTQMYQIQLKPTPAP